MKDLQWFPPIPEPRAPTSWPVIGPLIVAAALGGLLLERGHRALAISVWSTALLLLLLALISPTLRKQFLRATHWLGVGAGIVAMRAFLWPFYVLVFGAIRLALSVTRVDLLGLRRQSTQASYWQPAVPEPQRAQYYERLFTVESTRPKFDFLAWAIALVAFVTILAGSGELVLRSMGFGNPIVYRLDPRVGYYPAPNQVVHRYGGEIRINAFGMRSQNVTAEKPASTFRILMLGDSTLYGGSYIDQNQTYASQLETLLNQKPEVLPSSPRRVEVLAMGVNAWGPQHELAYLKEFGLFHADLVMVMGPPSDAYRPRYGIANLPFFAEGRRPEFAWQEFWQHLVWRYKQRTSAAVEGFESGPRAGENLADGIAAWLGIASLAQEQRARVDFEFLPNQDEAREGKAMESTERVLDALLPELAKKQIAQAYPVELFRSNLGVARLYHDRAHLDTAGHRIYALYLRDRVLQLTSAEELR
jgi:hypothetical protein